MKNLLLTATLIICMGASAQIVRTSTPEPILRGTQSDMYYPSISEDGRYLSFTDAQFGNRRVYDFVDNVTVMAEKTDAATMRAITAKTRITARTEGSELIITNNDTETRVSPVESYAGYLWPSVSPDGKHVMFVAAGQGIVITDLKGNIIARPGNRRLEAPVWFGNNHIVAMNTTDDGHNIESSQIIMLSMDGKETQALTKPESMTMFPAADSKSGRIVWNTIDGRLYQVKVELIK